MFKVVGIVDSWDLPPLPVRYMDACKSLKASKYYSRVVLVIEVDTGLLQGLASRM